MPSGSAVSGLLTGSEIENLKLVSEGFDPDSLQAASYDLRLGNKHFLFEDSGTWKAVFLGEPTELNEENNGISDPALMLQMPRQGSNKLIIPPFGSAIIQLKETIDLLSVTNQESGYLLIAGRFDLKLKTIYKGLISQQATQVEPCYKGKLYCFIHNLSSNPVVLTKNEKIATIEFSNVGAGLAEETRCRIILDTESRNHNKFSSERFTPSRTGIDDIRWLHTVGMLPEECGIAPIYRSVQDSIGDKVDSFLEKSDTIEKITDRVERKLSEKQNAMKIIIALVTAVITFFTANFLIEINAELRYFREELSFFSNSGASLEPDARKALEEHTKGMAQTRNTFLIVMVISVGVIAGLLLVLYFTQHASGGKKWDNKRKALEAQYAYLAFEKEHQEEQVKHPSSNGS